MEWVSLLRNFVDGDCFYHDVTSAQVTNLPGVGDLPLQGIVGLSQLRYVTLLPEGTATGGDVTLIRIVGDYFASFGESSLADFAGTLNGLYTCTIQLVLCSDISGTGLTFQPPTSALAQEKSNILWQQSFDAAGPARDPGTTTFIVDNAGDIAVMAKTAYPIDITVKRRWDRSQYRLVFTWSFDTGFESAIDAANNFGVALWLRGLFLTQGGI